jgi:hypothetical protein
MLSINDFEPLVDTEVQLSDGAQNYTATVTEVMKMTRHGDAQRDPFSVLFVISEEHSLPQQIYTLSHDRLGTMELFLVPLGPKAKGMCYEAVFT